MAIITTIPTVIQAKVFYTVGSANADYITDGVADDVQIQQAVDAAVLAGGGTVFIKEGTYNLAAQVTWTGTGITIMGAGMTTTLTWATGTNPSALALLKPNGAYTRIVGLNLDGNKTNNTGTGMGIYLYQSPRAWLEDLYIHDFSDNGILAEGTASNTSAHANTFVSVKVISCGGYGYWGKGFTYDCQFLNFWVGQCNVGMRLESGQNFLTNIHLWGNTVDGLQIRSNNNHLTNGYYESNGDNGIDIFSVTGNLIVGVQVWKNLAAGIAVASSDKTVIGNCVVYDNTGAGILVSGTTVDWSVTGSTFYDDQTPKTQTYGIQSTNTVDYGTVANNVLKAADHLTGSMLLVGFNNTLINNTGNPANTLPADAAWSLTQGRSTTAAGNSLTIQAGGALSGATNTAAGDLILSSGISTGNTRGNIKFNLATQGSTGTADNTPALRAVMFALSSNGPILSLGNTSASATGLSLTTNALALNGNAAAAVEMYRHSTANTAGNTLTIEGGGATLSATDKAGGNTIITSGIATGVASSYVQLKAYAPVDASAVPLASGTTDGQRLDRHIVGAFKKLTNNSATNLVNFTLASNTVIGGIIRYAVEVFDGTNLQLETGEITYQCANKGGVFSGNTVTQIGSAKQFLGSGTLAMTWAITGANPAVLSLNANSSLTPSAGYPRITYTVENLTQQAVAIQ